MKLFLFDNIKFFIRKKDINLCFKVNTGWEGVLDCELYKYTKFYKHDLLFVGYPSIIVNWFV